MCYFCSCFGWTLDLIQRTITFALACCLVVAVCFGLSVAIITGIAYGYNYCLAEFITFTRSDVTVYMRRGPYPKKPHDIILRDFRRSEGSGNYLSQNFTSDYGVMPKSDNSNTNSVSNIRMKNQETRKYAEKLTKYSLINNTHLQIRPLETGEKDNYKPATFSYHILTSPAPRVISVIPNIVPPTTLMLNGPQILMREFQPDDMSLTHTYKTRSPEPLTDDTLPKTRNTIRFPFFDSLDISSTEKPKVLVDTKENWPSERNSILFNPEHNRKVDLSIRPQLSIRHRVTSEDPIHADYPVNEQDDDDIEHKPV